MDENRSLFLLGTSSRRSFLAASAGLSLANLVAKATAATCRQAQADTPSAHPAGGKVIDTHIHLRPRNPKTKKYGSEAIDRYLRLQDDFGIRYSINIGIIGDDQFQEQSRLFYPYRRRLGSLYALDWSRIRSDAEFFRKAPDMLEKAVSAGALGLKCFKDLGLTVRDREGKLLAIDDSRLFPLWERAGKLGVIVAFHATDPVAFFAPWNKENERWKELELHPEWSFSDRSRYPERETVLQQRDNVIRRFPQVLFQGCHVGNNSEDLQAATRRMEAFPNLYLDVAARLGELGRHPSAEGNRFFTRFQDRLMFGTDHMFYADGEVQGAGPKKRFTGEENRKFYASHWRYFETTSVGFDHPTPIQGDWKIDGIGLEPAVLRKLYYDNAFRLYRLDRFLDRKT